MDLLEPYLNQASRFLQDIVDSVPALAKAFKDTFEMAGTSRSYGRYSSELEHQLV